MSTQPPQTTWFIPAVTVKLPDGSTLIKPGKAVLRASVTVVSKLTGVPRRTLHTLADCGLLTREKPTPYISNFYPGEVEDLLRKTAADPVFWDAVRTQAFLTGKDLRNSKPK